MFDPLVPALHPAARQMALESKPLFHPEVNRQPVRSFNLPERVGDWQPWRATLFGGPAPLACHSPAHPLCTPFELGTLTLTHLSGRRLAWYLRSVHGPQSRSVGFQTCATANALSVGEVKRIRGKKLPLTAAGVQGLRAEYTRSIEPHRARAADTLKLEGTLSDFMRKNARGLPKPGGRKRKKACKPAREGIDSS